MVCRHPLAERRPVDDKPGVTHCDKCGESFECSHPWQLKQEGHQATWCEGCGQILRLEIDTKLTPTKSHPRHVHPCTSHHPYH